MEQALVNPSSRERTEGVLYEPPPGFDEAIAADAEARGHYRALLDDLGAIDLAGLCSAVGERGASRELSFGTAENRRRFPLDPVPRLFTGEEWRRLERGLAQRLRALNAFLADLHGPREILAAGRLPERVIAGAARQEPFARAIPPPAAGLVGVAGFDVVRDEHGELLVLEDNLRTPSGLAYTTAVSEIVAESLPFEPPERLHSPAPHELLARALRAAAPAAVDDPFVVLLSDGPENSAWWEHHHLARALGIPILTLRELSQRGEHVLARVGDRGARRVDVIYRRTDESQLEGPDGERTWLGETLCRSLFAGTVTCLNGFGTGIADDKLVHAYVEEMIRFYLGEEPAVRSVPTYDLGDPAARAAALERIDELVVKPRDGYGGEGVIVCPHANPADRERAARLVAESPETCVAQETVALSTHPTVVGSGLEPRHVDLRAFAFATDEGEKVLAGGLTRVALDQGALVVNSSQNGGGKATWVLR